MKKNHASIDRAVPSALLLVALTCAFAGPARAQNVVTLANPEWNITLTDFGYSDFLLDNTPGFEGREYLSGEWAGAVRYSVGAVQRQSWLEPHFIYPNWETLSDFGVASPIAIVGVNADSLPIAESVITNAELQVTLRHEMIDTVIGTAMGLSPASSTNGPQHMTSGRYILKQTCTIRNISGAPVANLSFFQFLHSLNAQWCVFDDRTYAGAFTNYHHDLTEVGVDMYAVSAGSSAAGLEDYIGFQSSSPPDAWEAGYFGIEGNGVDDHYMGKPSDGVHRSVENNWSDPPYSNRINTDYFAPPTRWVSGAQRWSLGSLDHGQSVSLDLILALRTGTRVPATPGSSGGCNGGSSVPGGFDYEFEQVEQEGSCFGEFSKADELEIELRIANDDLAPLTFLTPGYPVQVWKVEFNGVHSGVTHLTFAYDPSALPPGFDESILVVYHQVGDAWERLDTVVDTVRHTVSVSVSSLSWFVLGTDGGVVVAVSAVEDPPGSGTVSGPGSYAAGSSVTLSAAAGAGFVFSNWSESGIPVSASPNYTFNAGADRSLVAHFAPVGSALSVSTVAQPANGGYTTGDGAYAPGSLASVVATPNPGYKFSKWLRQGVLVGTSRTNTFTVSSNVVLVAKFKPVYTVEVVADPEYAGEVEADPVYESGELAKLKAKPNAGYCFVNWTQNDFPVSASTTYQFNVTANRSLVGHFAAGKRIDAAADPLAAGTVSGGGILPLGDMVLLEAQANPGYVFLNWTENGVVVGETETLAFSGPASRSLVANFIAQPELDAAVVIDQMPAVAWPAAVHGWFLQECHDLSSNQWTESTAPVQVIGNQNVLVVDPLSGITYFRLHHP